MFRQLCRKHQGGTYLELGTWTGMGSTRFVLESFPAMTVIGIDTFKGSEEHQRNPSWKKIADSLWLHFCANNWDFRKQLYPFRMTTEEGMRAVKATGVQPDIVYIDAAHDADSVYVDIAVALQCFPKAIIVGDDYLPEGQGHPGVRLAIERAISEGLIQKKEFTHRRRVWHLTRNV